MDIKPIDQTVKNLLEAGFYRIPRFQRPYSWDQENVEEFWGDTIVAEDEDYFIGSFVVFRARGVPDLHYVVDGQQRLTTITLLLASMREALRNVGFESLAKGVQKLIEREDINNDLRYVLQSETPYPYLQEYIQKYGPPEVPASNGGEEEALAKAYEYLTKCVSDALASIQTDPTIAQEKKKEKQKEKLLSIRDKLLRLQLIVIQLDNEDDAYLIFETLNTRGKDLTVSDLIKNHLTRLIKPTNRGVDTARDRWKSILGTLEGSAANISVNTFLHHSWLSRRPYTTVKKLFKEIRRAVTKTEAQEFLDTLVRDAELYRQILEPLSCNWRKEEKPLVDALQALILFRVVQPVPMTLSILRAYREGDLSLSQAKKVLCSMENFHVQFTAVTAQRTGGGTALMYALAARSLLEAPDKNARARVLREFTGKLQQRVPSYQEFEANFREIVYLEHQTKQRPLVQYLLRRFDTYFNTGSVPNYEGMTIEHIAPQRPPSSSGTPNECAGMLGNLILVPQKMNEKLANLPFEKKRAMLEKRKVTLDSTLKDA